jgi:myo-inositol-1(or 4)-monophosphatase
VTEVDVAIEGMFRESSPSAFRSPAGRGTGREPGGPWPGWVFDPIDGTTNFAHGLPIFCASLALEIDGVAEVAAVYDPTRHELFTAEREGGAFLNGRPIRVSAASDLVNAMLVTGFPYDVHDRVDEIVGLFAAFVGRARAVRRLGSAAIDLCYVAAGRMDGFWESDLKPWDIAGGALIVAEAGGSVTDMAGAPFGSRVGHVLASNGLLHDVMLEVIANFRKKGDSRRLMRRPVPPSPPPLPPVAAPPCPAGWTGCYRRETVSLAPRFVAHSLSCAGIVLLPRGGRPDGLGPAIGRPQQQPRSRHAPTGVVARRCPVRLVVAPATSDAQQAVNFTSVGSSPAWDSRPQRRLR